MQKRKGKSDESAKKICGELEKRVNASSIVNNYEDYDGLYLKSFLLDTSVNLNDWNVSPQTLDKNIQSYIGKPVVLTPDFGHPNLEKLNGDTTLEHQLEYQEKFKIGEIIKIVKDNTSYSAIWKVTHLGAREALRSGELPPLYVSPQLRIIEPFVEEGSRNIINWIGTHLALVTEPAFTVRKAQITGHCTGHGNQCLEYLTKNASVDYCPKTLLNSLKSVYSSLFKNLHNFDESNIIMSQENITVPEKDTSNTEKNLESQLAEANKKIEKLTSQLEEERSKLKESTKDKEVVTKEKETLEARVAAIEKERRSEQISSIVSAEVIENEDERNSTIADLVESNLSIDKISKMFKPRLVAEVPTNTKQAATENKQIAGSYFKNANIQSESSGNNTPYWIEQSERVQYNKGGSN